MRLCVFANIYVVYLTVNSLCSKLPMIQLLLTSGPGVCLITSQIIGKL